MSVKRLKNSLVQTGQLALRIFAFLLIFELFRPFSLTLFYELGDQLPQANDQEVQDISDLMLIWLATLLAAVLGLISVALVDRYLLKLPRPITKAYGLTFKNFLPHFGQGYLLAGILLLIFVILLYLGGFLQWKFNSWNGPAFFLWVIFFLIQPFAEELVFRGILQNYTGRFFGTPIALMIASLAFVALHLNNDHFNFLAGLNLFAGGLLMGLLFQHSGNLWLCTGLHGGWNFIQSILLGIPVSGIETYSLLNAQVDGPNWITGGDFGVEGSLISFLLLLAACWYYRAAIWNPSPLAQLAIENKMTEIKGEEE